MYSGKGRVPARMTEVILSGGRPEGGFVPQSGTDGVGRVELIKLIWKCIIMSNRGDRIRGSFRLAVSLPLTGPYNRIPLGVAKYSYSHPGGMTRKALKRQRSTILPLIYASSPDLPLRGFLQTCPTIRSFGRGALRGVPVGILLGILRCLGTLPPEADPPMAEKWNSTWTLAVKLPVAKEKYWKNSDNRNKRQVRPEGGPA